MENQISESCLLCYSDAVVSEASSEHIRGLKTINNLFDVLGIPMKFFYELWPVVPPQFEINLTFCQHCESLIDQGLTLKNQLREVKSDLIGNARGGAVSQNEDVMARSEKTDLASPECRLFRHSFRKLVLDGDIGAGGLPQDTSGRTNLTSKVASEDSSAVKDGLEPSSPILFANENSRTSLDGGNAIFRESLPLDVQIREIQPDRIPSPASLVGFDFFANLNVSRDVFGPEEAVESSKVIPLVNAIGQRLPENAKWINCRKQQNKTDTINKMVTSQLKGRKTRVGRNPKRQKLTVHSTSLDAENDASAERIQKTADSTVSNTSYVGLGQSASPSDKKYKCAICLIACSSESALGIHTQEMHAEKDDRKLIFKCPVCNGELNSNKFFHPESRYSTVVSGEVKFFEHFFQLCDNHVEKCSKAQLLGSSETLSHSQVSSLSVPSLTKNETRARGKSSRSARKTSQTTEIPLQRNKSGRKIAKEPKQIYLYRRLDPISKCMLCQVSYVFSSLSRHYQHSHGLTRFSEDRFACADCHEIYMAKEPHATAGKVTLNDLDHFKEFAKQHAVSVCNRPKSAEFSCTDCKSLQPFATPKEFFLHDIQCHSHDEKFKCGLCSERFLYLPLLAQHVKSAHNASCKFVCGLCPDSFLRHKDYLRHLKASHVKNSVFACFICDIEEQTKYRYRAHMVEKHGLKNVYTRDLNPDIQRPKRPPEKYRFHNVKPPTASALEAKCFICERILHGPELLDLHLRELHEPFASAADLSFKCKCGIEFKKSDYAIKDTDEDSKYTYPTTINLSGDEEIVKSFSHYCNVHALICPQWTESAKLPQPSPFECIKCKKSFDSPNDYVLHLQSYFTHLLASCHICEFATHDSARLESHYYRIHNVKQVQYTDYYYCRYCRTCFDGGRPEVETGKLIKEDIEKFKEFATVHASCQKQQLDPKISYNCKFCGKAIITPSNYSPMELFKHEVEEHTRNFLKYCYICAAGYFTHTEFNRHVKSHDEKRFKCDICSSTFRNNMKWVEHMRVHNNDRAFVCHVCGKSFFAKGRLNIHEKIHRLDKKDWPCTMCGKMFASLRNVRSHQYIVHKKRRDMSAYLNRRSNISALKPQESQSRSTT